jgi:4'-phosphopantetheinyl transferase
LMTPSDRVIAQVPWRPAPARVHAADDTVHVWRVPLDLAPADTRVLSRDERARADRMKFPIDRHRWVASRTWLRVILGSVLDVAPENVEFAVGTREKPLLVGSLTRFNIAHSGDVALIAVGVLIDVGIDVEKVRAFERTELMLVAKRVLGSHVVGELTRTSRAEQNAYFHRAWVRHEALAKCDGRGLLDPEDAAVGAPPGALVVELDLGPAYAAALAVERAPRSLHLWRAA